MLGRMGEWLSDKPWLMEPAAVGATSLDYLWVFTPKYAKTVREIHKFVWQSFSS